MWDNEQDFMGEKLAVKWSWRQPSPFNTSLAGHCMLRASFVSDSEICLAPEAIEARVQSKLAVRLGGGTNHRTGLYNMILI